ncbi:MAG TPA: hydroxyacid dehydrogenase [Opitutae bacterium]|nr:hydroxyacid dehydrogenase [Opitutae bacterium]HBJ61220.1 hydroxyacid dehydrogenase [Opitutae bacterium]|tara:strand:+ start:321 stop:1445 length:1125 start_codon:yes stop_codon:yes gene_type:complete
MMDLELLQVLLLKCLFAFLMVSVVMSMAGYSVLAERKVSAWMQGRVGPNRTVLPLVGYVPVIGPLLRGLGMFQPLADGLKFLFKEEIVPGHVNKIYYYLAPLVALVPALTTMTVLPFGEFVDSTGNKIPLILANLDVGVLFIFAVSSLGVYGIVLAGWSSNSKYPFLGGIRSSAQMISYELAMGLSLLPVFLWTSEPGSMVSSLSLVQIANAQDSSAWLVLVQPLSALIFLIALFAETNRLPFDMPESETDLVGGFHTEYGSFKFGIFFVAEYAHIVIGSAIFTLIFLGGWHFLPWINDPWPASWIGTLLGTGWFLAKTVFLIFFFIWIRWTLPRFRYDQVMSLGWTKLLPLSLANLVFYVILITWLDQSALNT